MLIPRLKILYSAKSYFLVRQQAFYWGAAMLLAVFSACPSSPYTRHSASIILHDYQDRRDTAELLYCLQSANLGLAVKAAYGLALMPSAKVSEALKTAFLQSNHTPFRQACFFSIGQMHFPANAEWLLDCYGRASQTAIKQAALLALSKCPAPCVPDTLLALLIASKTIDRLGVEALAHMCRWHALNDAQKKLAAEAIIKVEKDHLPEFARTMARIKVPLAPLQITYLEKDWKGFKDESKAALVMWFNAVDLKPAFLQKTVLEAWERPMDYRLQTAYLGQVNALDWTPLLFTKVIAQLHVHAMEILPQYLTNSALTNEYLFEQLKSTQNTVLQRVLAHTLLQRNAPAGRAFDAWVDSTYASIKDFGDKIKWLTVFSSRLEYLPKVDSVFYQTQWKAERVEAFKVLLEYFKTASSSPTLLQQWFTDTKRFQIFAGRTIQVALKSADVGLVSEFCLWYLNEEVPFAAILPEFDWKVVLEILPQLQLPRDIETLLDVQKALRKAGKSLQPIALPSSRHAIPWERFGALSAKPRVVLATTKGLITLELWFDKVPGAVLAFLELADKEHFQRKRFHRVVPGFVVQTGCPRGDGYGALDYTLRSEWPDTKFEAGVLGYASAGQDTESAQIFITTGAYPHLNGRYTAFGNVLNGMEVLHQLTTSDSLISVTWKP